MSSVFDGFTNLYSLSKTLRFELKPVGKTRDFVKEEGFFQKDIQKADAYPVLKEKLDILHRRFIDTALQKISALSVDDKVYENYLAKVEMKDIYKKLRKEITYYFDGSKDLGCKEIIDRLVQEFPESQKELAEFKGFTGYLTTYNQNRANLYKDDDCAGRIAFRLIDENLPRFLRNKSVFELLQKEEDFDVIERNENKQETTKQILDYLLFFELSNYYQYITKDGIESINKIIGDFNYSINLHRQKHNGKKLPMMQILYKLPLSEKETPSWLPKQIEKPEELKMIIDSTLDRVDTKIIPFVQNFFSAKNDYDYNGIYVSIKTLELWGGLFLQGWGSLRLLTHEITKDGEDAKLKKVKKDFPFVSLQELKDYIDLKQDEKIDPESFWGKERAKDVGTGQWSEYFFELLGRYMQQEIQKYNDAKQAYNIEQKKETEKNVLDVALALWRFLGGFALIHKKTHILPDVKEGDFYDGDKGLDALLYDESFDPIHIIYDKVRNYLTKKPYSNDEKIKVNFENATLLGGWDQNKERDNYGIVLRKDNKYLLAIMKKGKHTFFDETKNKNLYDVSGSPIQKMIYKLLPGPNKMLPKVIFAKSNESIFKPSAEILRIRKEESFKQGDKFLLKDLHTWIDYLKHCLTQYEGWKGYDFVLPPTQKYEKINEFYHDVESQGYKLSWIDVKEAVLMDAVDRGDVYLFDIYNKDFNEFAQGRENIHTKYFKAVFAGGKDNLFKLNGEADVFWRKGKEDLENKEGRISKTHKIVIRDKKRYTEDKIMLHVPITLNFCRNELRFNDRMKQLIASHPKEFTILGIDRGEKHLLYYSLIKQDGTIIKTGSWNSIQQEKMKEPKNYQILLDDREKKRKESQYSWNIQDQIKDLKAGYLSQVIHEISKIVVEHNAIIVLEDLNGGFKRGRQGIEKNVYQQFELALARKFNHLVFKKDADNKLWTDDKAGGTLKGYQLTPPISGFGDLSFQTGMIFYTPAAYTSTTCPCCGWRKHLSLKYSNEKNARNELSALSITKVNDHFEVTYKREQVKGKNNVVLQKTEWVLSTKDQKRLVYNPLKKGFDDAYASYNLNQEFETVFANQKVFDYSTWLQHASAGDLKKLMRALGLLMKMRNAKSGEDIDYIQCPACGFHSDKGFQDKEFNGDANGAYNIARKGKFIVDKIVLGEKTTTVSQVECDNGWSR